MPLNLNSKADMKGEVIKGLRMDITGVHHWRPTLTWDYQLCILFGQWYLLEEECQITTWDWAVEVVPTNRWKRSETSPQTHAIVLISWPCPLKEVWSSCQDIPWLCYCLDIYGQQSWTQLWRNTHHFWHLQRGLHQEWKKRKVKRNGIPDVISLKHNLLVLLKALLPVCIVHTAQGESQVANIAWGKADCYICHEALTLCCIYHTNEAAVL